jgi:flagellar motor protein MotB
MLIRKTLLFIPLVASFLATSCTTRYQDMLRDRDAQIRELSNDVARLRASNEDLERQRGTPQPANAAAPKAESPNLLNELQKDIGDDATVGLIRGQISIGVEDKVTFDSGSTTLKDTSHKVLRNIASALKGKFTGRRIYVSGHTDSDPIDKTKDKFSSNRHLSALRADAVARYLIQQGVPEASIVIVGFGQFDPRDPKTKARNRRVEIAVGESL